MTTTSYSTRPRSRRLTDRTLAGLGRRVDVPCFDRSALTPGIVHLGVGGFHRAHQAVYLDDLATLGHTGWGETGVGLRSPAMRDTLRPQDCLFTVVQRGAAGDNARVVGSMVGYRYAPEDPAAVLGVLTDPRTRMVTLTITGGGYLLDATGAVDAAEPDLGADLASPGTPTTVHGYLVEALDRRRRAGLPAFTVLSCDNVPDNGAAARAAVVGFARLRDEGLAAWIDAHAAFPASMVDRITPQTDDRARRLVEHRFGIRDRAPVITEAFSQWIVEDRFCNGRPPLDEVGVQFVGDVAPYKLMKTRLLNASHSALGYLASLTGRYRTTSEAMTDPVLVDYLATMMSEEVGPSIPRLAGIDLGDYRRTLLSRFANPRIGDQLSRLCAQGSTKMPAYLLPSLVEARQRGQRAPLLTLAVAAWARYLHGYDSAGNPLDVRDTRRDVLQPLARMAGGDPRPLLGVRAVFGTLGEDPGFVAELRSAMLALETYGPIGAVRRHLAADLTAAA